MRTRGAGWSRILVCVAVLIGLTSLAMAPAAVGQQPSKPGRPVPLARYFPRRDLVVYVEFDGLDAHRDSWTKSAAYRLLNETTTGAMLEQSAAHLLDLMMAGEPQVPVRGGELVALGKHLLRGGFAMGVNRSRGVGSPRCFALVIRGGATGALRAAFDRFLKAGEGPRSPVKQVEKPGGRTVQVLSDSPGRVTAWWAEGDDLVVSLVSPIGVDAIVAAVDGREPNALDHPTRRALRRGDDAPGFEPVGLAFFDMAGLPALPREAVALGLDRIKRFDYRWGFHGKAIQSIVGAVVPAPRTGIPALFDQPTFDVRHLPPLPGGLSGFTVLSLDSLRFYDQLAEAAKAIEPSSMVAMMELEALFYTVTGGSKLRDDFLAPMGSRVVLYTVPTRINTPPNVLEGLARAMVYVPKSTIVLEVKDRSAAAKMLDAVAKLLNDQTPAPSAGLGISFRGMPMKRLKGPETGYILPALPGTFPFPAGGRPTVLLGQKEIVWGMSPATARRALALAERRESGGLPPGDPLTRALDHLPDRLTFLTVVDAQQSLLPDVLVSLPNLIDSADMWQNLPFLFLPFEAPPNAPSGEGSKVAKPAPAFDMELIPEPDDIRPFLFPSVSAMSVDDQGIRFISREAFPTINPATAVPVAIAMLVPVAYSARVAAQRSRSVNDLKQIGLAMQNFHETNKRFPADVRSKDGKPLLSWRVQILPFLEQQALFDEFKLDEPWDSPHNKALLERMPTVFAVPNARAKLGKTVYRGLAGKRTIFDPAVPKGVALASITDGTSNTIGVVEAREAVPWTKPDSEIPFDESLKPEKLQPLRDALGNHSPGGFHVLLCDGSVRFIKDSIALTVLRALITRNGGEVISSDSF